MRFTILLVFCAASMHAQWWNPFSRGTPKPPTPPAVVDCVIQARTWEPGSKPRVTDDDWKKCPQMLEAHVTAEQLANVEDPSKFTEERLKVTTPPTRAYWRNEIAPGPTSAMSPRHLSTQEQARVVLFAIQPILPSGCAVDVRELNPINPFSQPVYSGADWKEDRRHWYLVIGRDNLNVNLIREAYATGAVEAVERRLKAEVAEACR